MKYLKVIFNLTDSDKNTISDKLMAQASKDVLCDNLADIGFEAFENDEKEGVTGYVKQKRFRRKLVGKVHLRLPNRQRDDIIYRPGSGRQKLE